MEKSNERKENENKLICFFFENLHFLSFEEKNRWLFEIEEQILADVFC